MNSKIKILSSGTAGAALLAALLFTACARDDFDWLIGTPINVTASAEEPTTRAASNIQTTTFDAGAQLNAYYKITGGEAIGRTPTVLTAVAADANGKNRLTPDVQPYYPSAGTVDIMALYPKIEGKEVTKGTTSFTVESDQQAEADYKKSDLMWAGETEVARTTGDVELQFKHLMAKMTLKVTGQGVKVKKVSLTNIYLSATTSFSASSYSVVAPTSGEKSSIVVASAESPAVDNTLNGSVLFPNQTVNGNFIEVKIAYGEQEGIAYFSVNNKVFESGYEYTADLVVGRQDIGFVTELADWKNNGGSIAVQPGSSAGLKVEAIEPQQYDGTPKIPELKIWYFPNDDLKKELADTTSSYLLVAVKDYTAEYFNNTDQGTALVIIKGQNSPDRTGKQELLAKVISQIEAMTSFEIIAHTGELTYPSDSTETPHKLEVEYEYNTTVNNKLNDHGGDGTITFTSSDTSVADVTNSGTVTIRGAGDTRITARMAADGNYTAASAYYDLTVKPRSLKSNSTGDNPAVTATIAGSTSSDYSVSYSGEAYAPAVVVKDKGRTLQENKHYTYSVTKNVNCGTATITIKGMDNYSSENDDAITLNFTINAVTPTISMTSTDAVILAKGQKFTRRATTNHGTVTYSSSPAGIVDISADGVVEAKTTTTTNQVDQTVTITASVAADTEHGDKPNWVATSKSYTMTVAESNWTYSYTGNVQTWTCPVDGIWELEAMGAQGATVSAYSGGKGADVAGQVFIKKGQKLYIYVGQNGTNGKTTWAWNGGGYGSAAASGGGATDFALKSAAWDHNDHLNSRILVAGGGGGALDYTSSAGHFLGAGGDGGGEGDDDRADYEGMTGVAGSLPGKGGTLSAGGAVTSGGSGGGVGSFGKGGCYTGSTHVGCGGGGWYGGGSGSAGGRQGSGGGGSSFIYNDTNVTAAGKIKDGKTYNELIILPSEKDGNYFTTSNLEIVPTTLITGGSPDANGQARITYKSAE